MNSYSSICQRTVDNLIIVFNRTWSSVANSESITLTLIDNMGTAETQLHMNNGYDEDMIKNFLYVNHCEKYFDKIEMFYEKFISENKKIDEYYQSAYYRQSKVGH